MMLELNYTVVPNNIEIGRGGLSQIFCGRLSENWGKSSTGFGYLLHKIFFASAYVNVANKICITYLDYAIVCPS
jgi:hypothetical protein